MIDHGTACAGEPCTCSCYTRHEPAPGVHQDIPHPNTQCMESSTLDYCCVEYYRNGTIHGRGCKASKVEHHHHLEQGLNTRECPPYCTAHNHEEMGA